MIFLELSVLASLAVAIYLSRQTKLKAWQIFLIVLALLILLVFITSCFTNQIITEFRLLATRQIPNFLRN